MFITGSSRGIGAAIARQAQSDGYEVVLHGSTVSDPLILLSKELRCPYLVFDVTNEVQVREGMGSFEKLDVLVNSAGVNISRPFQELSKSDWTRVYDVNVFGLASVTRMAVPALSQADNIGKIVNIASIKGVYSSVGRAAYASSKAAVISLTTALSKELAPRILVNAVAPGFVDTEMTLNTMSARLQRQIDSILLGRIAQPIEVANAVLFLAGDRNSYITGQTLNVDGGFSIKYE